MNPRLAALAAVLIVALLTGCAQYDLVRIAGDSTNGRQNNTPGSAAARQYLIDQLKPISNGLNTGATGDAAYTQATGNGTNVVAVIPGTDLAGQYVVVGAHYDHLGSSCTSKEAGDTICNGATDNAAGVAAALGIARSIAAQKTKPRRSVVIAFWDQEEDGLIGSAHYVANPLVPLAQTVGYVNFDIQGANLSPSLRETTFAVGAESGGPRFQQIVGDAAADVGSGTRLLSSIFGQNRSDYVNFLGKQIPTVFFTDATGPCYHSNQDEVGIVDFPKLAEQTAVALRVTRELANTGNLPSFAPNQPLVTFSDAVVLQETMDLLWQDRDRFSAQDQQTLANIRADLTRIVSEGSAAFGSDDANTVLGHAATVVINILPKGPCDGFLPPAQQQQARTLQRFSAAR